ncbi:hypothetical protein ACFXKC_40025 [Streptomyces sp. NPDC059340]|uniref:hypothetical protein n=1 Tax=Streptomyces sp. NPDC059340 TaxID=3346806 RepID=UPI003683482E
MESELSDGWFSAVYRVRLNDGRPAVVELAVRRIRFGTRRQRLRQRKGPIAEMSEASSGTSQAQAGQPEQRAARRSPRPHLYAPALERLAIVIVERTPDQSNRRTVRPLSYPRLLRPGVSAATFLHQHLAESTATSHVSRILTDTSARDRVQAMVFAPLCVSAERRRAGQEFRQRVELI